MQNIYCLSGLGADEQIFSKLEINNAKLVHLPWANYADGDTLPEYALRMMKKIDEPDPIVLGVSFGGMLAIEIAKAMPVQKTILVSSAKSKYEVSHFDGIMKTLIMSRIAPAFIYKMPSKYLFERFGATNEEEDKLLRGILKRSDGHFMSWAMRAIQLWQNETIPDNVLHIHGTADQIIPPQTIKPNYWIQGGTHLMVYNRANEIAAIINNELYTHGRLNYETP